MFIRKLADLSSLEVHFRFVFESIKFNSITTGVMPFLNYFSFCLVGWARKLDLKRPRVRSPCPAHFFHGDLVMKKILRPFSLFRCFKKSSFQLLALECALSTGKLPRRLAKERCG